MVYNREAAALRAEASRENTPGTCQLWTRTMFGAPSAGDQDRDGDADAVDGWKSEPASARHSDRNPPRGTPVAWSGGRNGFGHRAISLGGGKIRSTDAGGSGVVATVDLGWVERNWGLNYLGWSETITGILIPKPPAPEPTSREVKIAHISLQVHDSKAEIAADVENIFQLLAQEKYQWITGTEAFGPRVTRILEAVGGAHGFRVERAVGQDCWIAVRKSFIAGNFDVHWQKIIEGGTTHRDLGVFDVSFDTDKLGRISVFAEHLLTHGQPNSAVKNHKVVTATAKRASELAAGTDLAFIGADKNMNDRFKDTFLGTPFTSLGDELKKHEPTHEHGRALDVIGTWDRDKRVRAKRLRVLDDTEFKLFGDHFLVTGVVEVKFL